MKILIAAAKTGKIINVKKGQFEVSLLMAVIMLFF